MKIKLRQTMLWTFFWLQIFLIFLHLTSLMHLDIFTYIYLGSSTLYCLYFIAYQALFAKRSIGLNKQIFIERLNLIFMSILTIAYSTYIFGNTAWIMSDDATIDVILVEFLWPSALIVTTLLSIGLSINRENMLKVTDNTLWNAKNDYDKTLIIVLCILLTLLVLSNSKLIPGVRREYHQLVRTAIEITVLATVYTHAKFFLVERMNYITMIFGFTILQVLEAAVFFVYKLPAYMILSDGTTDSLFFAAGMYGIVTVYLCLWSAYLLFQERKAQTKK